MRSVFVRAFGDAAQAVEALRADTALGQGLETFASWIADTFRSGGRVLACGNGGSLADAMHFCEEFTGRFRNDRKPYAAIPLSDPTHLTCTANDYGYEHVFSRLVDAYGRSGDLLLVLSTSGNSPSILRALEAAKEGGVRTVAFLGRGGGHAAAVADLALVFPGATSDRIQELHMLALHAVIEAVETELGHA